MVIAACEYLCGATPLHCANASRTRNLCVWRDNGWIGLNSLVGASFLCLVIFMSKNTLVNLPDEYAWFLMSGCIIWWVIDQTAWTYEVVVHWVVRQASEALNTQLFSTLCKGAELVLLSTLSSVEVCQLWYFQLGIRLWTASDNNLFVERVISEK